MKRILITLLLLSPIFSFGQVNLKNGLVACYPFNASANDESGNGNNGTVNGATLTTDRYGKANSAYNFDGISDFIEISPSKLQTTEFSYSLWVKPSSIPAEGIAYFLFSVGSESGDQDLTLNKSYANANDGFTGGGYLGIGETVFCQKGASPNVNQWYHLVFVRETNVYKVYLDGNLMCTTSTVTKPPFYGTGIVAATIGSRRNQSQFAHCVLDDISLYNRAITSEEVTALYQTTKSPATVDLKKGLVACYPFNGNAKDETGNGNNGTVNGAALTTDRLGKANSAYSFNGISDFIEINSTNLQTTEFSYSLWVKPSLMPTPSSPYILFSVGSDGGDQDVSLNEGDIYETSGFTGAGYTILGDFVYCHQGTNVNLNQWYHIVFVRETNAYKLYVDGYLKCVTSVADKPSYGTEAVAATIGCRRNQSQFANCVLDDISLYNRPLSSQEVTTLFQGAKSIPCEDGIIACHPFSVMKTK